MPHYKYVIVILVYRNADDLIECIDSIKTKIKDSKVIVVNAYYDDCSEKRINNIADSEDCVFINIENKGYSFGNNRGIDYAVNNIDFDYLIISNPDIVIRTFDDECINENKKFGIIAPKIIAASGRLQNPMSVMRNNISEYLEYEGLKNRKKFLFAAGVGLNKITRWFAVLIHKKNDKPYKIYAAHGSFVIFTRKTIEQLYPVYDENLFLFAEEGVLAKKAKDRGIETGQLDSIIIEHKEDGSMKLSNISISDELRKANIYYYETYIKNRQNKN